MSTIRLIPASLIREGDRIILDGSEYRILQVTRIDRRFYLRLEGEGPIVGEEVPEKALLRRIL